MRGRGSLSGAQRRAHILAAARSLFIERGFESVRMGDVAAAAHVSRALVYAHFPSTAAILDELFARALDELSEKLRPLLERVDADPGPILRQIVRVLVGSDDLLAVLFSGGSPAFHRSRHRQLAQRIGPLVRPYLPRPPLGPFDGEIVLLLFEGLGLYIRSESLADPEVAIDNLARFLLRGLAPMEPGSCEGPPGPSA